MLNYDIENTSEDISGDADHSCPYAYVGSYP